MENMFVFEEFYGRFNEFFHQISNEKETEKETVEATSIKIRSKLGNSHFSCFFR
jgi:hypothetical protein